MGGGFGGIYTALHLEKLLGRDSAVEITLVNRENFFLFTPMLHEVAASDLDITDIVNPIRKLLKRTQFFHGEVLRIELDNHRVVVFHGGDERHAHTLAYDHLVIALGTVTNFFGNAALATRAVTMKSLGDAIHLRNRLIENLEQADFECCAALREPLLTVVVAGGGFSGVETIASVNDFLREALPFYRNLRADMLRLVLVHPGDEILPELGPDLGRYARRKLGARGVEIRTRTKVTGVTGDTVTLSDGTAVRCDTIVWTAGTAPNPHLEALPCVKERGRVRVNEFLEVPDFPGVWSLGDAACISDPRTGKPYPPTAQHAIRQAKTLARNLVATIRDQPKSPFVFNTIGALATIGRRTGVARIFGVNFSGFLAWWMWRTIYLSKLPRFEKKCRVALDWTLDVLFTKDLVQFHTARTARAAPPAIREEIAA